MLSYMDHEVFIDTKDYNSELSRNDLRAISDTQQLEARTASLFITSFTQNLLSY